MDPARGTPILYQNRGPASRGPDQQKQISAWLGSISSSSSTSYEPLRWQSRGAVLPGTFRARTRLMLAMLVNISIWQALRTTYGPRA